MEEHRRTRRARRHRVIDPLGLALGIRRHRRLAQKDNEVLIDSAGELYDGTKMEGQPARRS